MSVLDSLVQPTSKILIGNDAAWHLAFHREENGDVKAGDPEIEFGRADYYAEIQASLPSGLEGGVYTFTIEGLTDAAYAAIAQGNADSPTVVRLYLYWRDTNANVTGYVKNLAGLTDTLGGVKAKDLDRFLVAELRIGRVSRRAGARRYETTITAKERVFAILDFERLCAGLDPSDLVDAAKLIAEGHGITPIIYTLRAAPDVDAGENTGADDEKPEKPEKGGTLLGTLRNLGKKMAERSNQHGRGMYLIREGKLHIGPRDIDSEIELAIKLDLGGGLIQAEKLEPLIKDEHFNFCDKRMADPTATPETRDQFRLTMKGRPDMKPGHVVKFKPHEADVKKSGQTAGALGALVSSFTPASILPSLGEDFANATRLYISSVEHRLGRTSGWVTTVTGVAIVDAEEAWDTYSDLPSAADREETGTETAGAPATPEQRAARAIARRIASTLNQQRHPQVGEVRRMVTQGRGEPPGQTLTVWSGLERADGRPHQGRRRPIRRPSPAPAQGVAYITPFAWGKCGLVLPRYPGTRVLVGYRNGQSDDPMALGALWESGHGPESEPGDWWLILPVDVPEDRRAEVSAETVPDEPNGNVTHDLIDATGRRAIEVTQLTITVGSDTLQQVGSRPAHGADDVGVTIEHKGAKVMIKDDGSIVLEAAKNIELKAPGGEISLTAKDVKVHVSGSMDVGS